MDKKSWPWKKKLAEKMSSLSEGSETSPHSASMQAEEQQEGSPTGASDVAPSEDSSSEPSLASSRCQLYSSIAIDVNAKDNLVKQHMKIAEEAVAGWEKAEAESAELKERLEAAVQQKVATEDRVSHLDGALKECMKQLRHVREEQEQKIHDAVIKKTREWDKIRTDLEVRLNDATNELCEALAENQAMSKSLQERAKTIAELSDIKAKLQADSGALQVRLASAEKENARFKYELHVLSKELELRNGECEYVKRSEGAANKQNLERSKKIGKLEEECQRLRQLVKKRQPSPAPMSCTRGEVDPTLNERIRRQSPCRRSTTSLPLKTSEISGNEYGLDDGLREKNKVLSDQLLAMQDEAKTLREFLAKKEEELKAARLMCARTASKLADADKQIDIHSRSFGSTKSISAALFMQQSNDGSMDLSIESVSGDSGQGDACAESWATALMAELAHINCDNKVAACGKVQSPITLDLMDDFAEMEKLASLSSPDGASSKKGEKNQGSQNCVERLSFSKGSPCGTEQELEAVNELCDELRAKLTATEEKLQNLQEKQFASDALVNQLQQMLALKFDLQAEGEVLRKAIEAAKLSDQGEKGDLFETESRDMAATTEGERDISWEVTFASHTEQALGTSGTEFIGMGADLAAAVRKVLDIVESIGQTDYNFPYNDWISAPPENEGLAEFSSPGKQWRSSGLDACVESLINLCNSLVQGKVDIIDFIAEVASALDWLVGLIFTPPDKTTARNVTQVLEECHGKQVESSDSEMISAESSPAQLLCNSSDGEDAKTRDSHDVLPDQSSVSNLSFQFSDSSMADEDAHKSEKAALKVSLEAEMKKTSKYESEILRLKVVNDQLELSHEHSMGKILELEAQVRKADEKIQRLNQELLESQSLSDSLEAQLQNLLSSKTSLENVVVNLEYAKNALELELHMARENVESLETKVLALEEELSEEIQCRKEAELRLLELKKEKKQQGEESTLEHPQSSNLADDEAGRLRKEQEIAAAAEKLVECQQTILDLGKQLKALGVSKSILNIACTSPPESESPSLKIQIPSAPVQRFRSTSDQVCSTAVDKELEAQCNGEQMPNSLSRERERKHDQGMSAKPARNAVSLTQEEPATPAAKRGGQRTGKHVRLAPSDVYTQRGNNRYPSPTHGTRDEKEGGQAFVASSHTSVEPVVSSPLRSPARFLSLRSKNPHEPSKHGDNELVEKHGSSGFSRFFARTKSGH